MDNISYLGYPMTWIMFPELVAEFLSRETASVQWKSLVDLFFVASLL